MNADINNIQSRLYALDGKLQTSAKKKLPEKEWLTLFHEVCNAFRAASPEERVDIQIAFEDRHALLNQFTEYLARMTQNAAQISRGSNPAKTIKLLEEGILADAIIDGRVNLADVQRAQNQLVSTAEEVHFNINKFLQPLETTANTYVMRAYQLQKANQIKQAMQVLGRAIQLNPALQKNEKIAQLASDLTGESPRNALMTLEDSFLRNRFLEDWENPRERRFKDRPKGMVGESEKKRPPKSSSRNFPVSNIVFASFGLIVFGVACKFWFDVCRDLFGNFPSDHYDGISWFTVAIGLLFIGCGVYIAYRRKITIHYRLRPFGYLGPSFLLTFAYEDSSATVVGLCWVVAGVVFLGTGARAYRWITASGLLDSIFSLRYGFILALGMAFIALILGLIMQFIEGR